MSRGALDFLQSYGNDDLSEDEIVPGPKVSTKRLHHTDSEDEDLKQKLPVPALFKSNRQIEISNPEMHDGKIRNFPHERGNWATYVYIPFTSQYGINELIEVISGQVHNIKLCTVDHFHVSLTRTVVLKYHWIDSFVTTVTTKLKGMRRFLLMFDNFEVYCNDERTRTFLGLQIKTGYDSLLSLSKILDICLKEYKLETYYQDPSFHMSLMWCLGDRTEELKQFLPILNEIFLSTNDNLYIDVTSIECKAGNKLFSFSMYIFENVFVEGLCP